MSTDEQQYCCSAGVCCDEDKQLTALKHLFVTRAHLTPADAETAAEVMMRSFDMLPKAAGLRAVVSYIQAHPYR